MKFKTYRVWYKYPAGSSDCQYFKDYTVPENEPFAENCAFKQWQRDHRMPHELVAFCSVEEVIQESLAKIVQLPLGFCETKYPGYFWNANEHKLYSLKSGVLKEMPRRQWNARDGYDVSHLGKRRHLRYEDLLKIVPMRVIIPTQPVPKRAGSRWS